MRLLTGLILIALFFCSTVTYAVQCPDLWEEPEYKKWVALPYPDSYQHPEYLEQLIQRCDKTSGRYSLVIGFLADIYAYMERFADAIIVIEGLIGKEGESVSPTHPDASLYDQLFYYYALNEDYKTSFSMISRFLSMWSSERSTERVWSHFNWDKRLVEEMFGKDVLGLKKDIIDSYRDVIIAKYDIKINTKKLFPAEGKAFCRPLQEQNWSWWSRAQGGLYNIKPEVTKEYLLLFLDNNRGTHCETDIWLNISYAYFLAGDLENAIKYHEINEENHVWGYPKNGSMYARIPFSGEWYHAKGDIEKARYQYVRYLVYAPDWFSQYSIDPYLRLMELEAGKGPFDPEFLLQLAGGR